MVLARWPWRDDGATTVTTLLAVGFTLAAVMVLLNVLVFMYARGVVRTAVDEGVRAGSRVGAGPPACEARARAVLQDLMPGPLGADIAIGCRPSGATGELTAVANATLRSPLPGMPAWSFQTAADAVQETGGSP